MDENPVDPVALKLTVNGRYPDTVWLATVPARTARRTKEWIVALELIDRRATR